jgi:hypothetical protein
VFLAIALELFDAAEGVWHKWGAYCRLPLTMAHAVRDFKTIL